MVELMIAMLLGIIMLGAIGAIYLSSKRTYASTETMSRVQEGARFATQFLARELRMAGYNNTYETGLVTKTLLFPAGGGWASGQVLTGVNNSGGSGSIKAGTDSITIRYSGNGAGIVRDCLGNTVAAGTVVPAILFISDNDELTCNVNGGGDNALVDGISDMQLEYGVDAGSDRSADSYVTANNVTNWLQVVSVRMTLGVAGSADRTGGTDDITRKTVTSVVALRNQLP